MTATHQPAGAAPALAPLRVADVVKPAVAVPGHASFKRILRIMINTRARAVPVVNPDGQVIGIVSDADLLRRAVKIRSHLGSGHDNHPNPVRPGEPLTAARLMTTPALTIGPDQAVDEAARALATAGVRQLV